MAKFVVKVIAVLLKNNTLANYGEIIDGANFATPAETLREGGYIAPATKEDYERAKQLNSEPEDEDDDLGGNEGDKPYSDMLKAELQEELTKREIEFDAKATNADLIALLEKDDADKE